jgi:aminoglycoside/choline kinase family phosphotransferase
MKTNDDNQQDIHLKLEELHIKHFGCRFSRISEIKAHGSDRKIYRLWCNDNSTSIGIFNSNKSENRAFIGFARHFRRHGLNVPEIYAVSDDLTNYITEDLGSQSLLCLIGNKFTGDIINLYREVIDSLIRFQTEAGEGIDYSLCYQFSEFSSENIDYDLNYFINNYLGNFTGKNHINLLINDFEKIKHVILSFDRNYFLYRDFQSRNIMIRNNTPYFIDFQSGRKGALLYDIASLLYDAKADIPQQLREEMLDYYLGKVSEKIRIDREKFIYGFWFFCIIRILQALGAYGYLGLTKGRKEFLESIPYALRNINFILSSRIGKNELPCLAALFNELNHSKLI